MKSFLILILSLINFSYLFAGNHPLADFKGGPVSLKTYDHAFSGSIRDFVIFANNDESTGKTSFLAKKDGSLITTEIKKQEDGSFGSLLSYSDSKGVLKEQSVKFISLDKSNNTFTFEVDGNPVKVSVTAPSFANNHFKKPSYHFDLGKSKFSVHMKEGEACYNFSRHIISVILIAYFL